MYGKRKAIAKPTNFFLSPPTPLPVQVLCHPPAKRPFRIPNLVSLHPAVTEADTATEIELETETELEDEISSITPKVLVKPPPPPLKALHLMSNTLVRLNVGVVEA